MLSFNFVILVLFLFHSIKITLLAGPHCFLLSFTFFDTMFSNNDVFFFIVFYCKDVLNTGDCVLNNALKYDRSLLICRDYFLRIGFCLWMYVFLWNITVKM